MQFGDQNRIYPKLNPKLKNDLTSIPPIEDEGLVYYPCDVELSNGELINNVVLVKADEFINLWGNWPDEDNAKNEIKIDDVVSILKAQNRLPKHVEIKLSNIHETRMGGVDFRLILTDGREEPVCTGGFKYFLKLKNGLSLADIKDIRAVDRSEIVFEPEIRDAKYYWCLFS